MHISTEFDNFFVELIKRWIGCVSGFFQGVHLNSLLWMGAVSARGDGKRPLSSSSSFHVSSGRQKAWGTTGEEDVAALQADHDEAESKTFCAQHGLERRDGKGRLCCSVLSSVNPVMKLQVQVCTDFDELTTCVVWLSHICDSVRVWCGSLITNTRCFFHAELFVQPEEIVLCVMSTHSDPQLLPYIWALQLIRSQLLIESNYWICMHTPPTLYF